MPTLSAVHVEPLQPTTATILWLHGLGADGHDFEPVAAELGLSGVSYVFPHAPLRPVTINQGYVMRAWYDIAALDLTRGEDEAGIRASQKAVEELIEREASRGIGPSRIVLAGFSQGGAIALHTGLRHPERLAGILALSTYLPLADRLPEEAHASNARTPIWMAHGTADGVVPVTFGQRSCNILQSAGYPVEWHTYPMGHSVCAAELGAISAWLKCVLPATS
jgi:phospholipase/carboxylesterase